MGPEALTVSQAKTLGPAASRAEALRAALQILCCPACRGPLTMDESQAQVCCQGCQTVYPIQEDGILLLNQEPPSLQAGEQDFRNRLAEAYAGQGSAELLGLVARHHCREVMQARAEGFRSAFRAGDWILDIGMGFGWHWLTTAGHGRILGLDLSLGNLRIASRLLAGQPDVALVLADAASLPIKDRSVAGLWSVQTFQHFPRPVLEAALQEADRVLKEDFRIEVHNLHPSLGHRLAAGLRRLLGRRASSSFAMQWLSARQWEEEWRSLRAGRTVIERGYSELFFHPDLGFRPQPYPLWLEQRIFAHVPGLAAWVARQSHLHLRPLGPAAV